MNKAELKSLIDEYELFKIEYIDSNYIHLCVLIDCRQKKYSNNFRKHLIGNIDSIINDRKLNPFEYSSFDLIFETIINTRKERKQSRIDYLNKWIKELKDELKGED